LWYSGVEGKTKEEKIKMHSRKKWLRWPGGNVMWSRKQRLSSVKLWLLGWEKCVRSYIDYFNMLEYRHRRKNIAQKRSKQINMLGELVVRNGGKP
jgi:hypothetical protein